MKRSEMVKQINKELRAQSGGESDIDGYQLLVVILSLGMLPPSVESGYKKWGFNPYRENNYWEDEE